jgi:hypothetical protein
MSKRSLNQVISLFNEIGEKHKQINHFYFGSFLSAMKEENVIYPLLVVDVTSASINENSLNLSLIVSVCDKVDKAHKNMNEVQSDTLEIVNDIVMTLQSDKWKSFSNLSGTQNAQRFVDRSLDEVTGWTTNINLNISSKKNLCAIPFDNYDFDGVYSKRCEPVEIFEDGVLVDTVASGGSYSYTTGGGSVSKRSSEPYKTGQTVAYATGDDGDLEMGNGTDFYTLSDNNGFGSTNRFTLKDGTQLTSADVYGDATVGTSKVVVDWASWDRVNDKVLCYFTDRIGGAADIWDNQIAKGLIAPSGEPTDGWHLTNIHELSATLNYGGNSAGRLILNYFEFYDSTTIDLFTSTTNPTNTAEVYRLLDNESYNIGAKTLINNGYQCRYYTLTELGL